MSWDVEEDFATLCDFVLGAVDLGFALAVDFDVLAGCVVFAAGACATFFVVWGAEAESWDFAEFLLIFDSVYTFFAETFDIAA